MLLLPCSSPSWALFLGWEGGSSHSRTPPSPSPLPNSDSFSWNREQGSHPFYLASRSLYTSYSQEGI